MDLRHHIGLSLGPAVDMTNWAPEPNLEKALCPASLADTLGLQRRAYWDELNPILKKWKSVNNSNCPECKRLIKVNMGRHIRLMHLTYVFFGGVRSSAVLCCSPRSSTPRTTLKVSISSRRVMGHYFTNVSDSTVLNGLGAGHSLTSGRTPTRPFGWTWRWRAGRVRN